jgi:SAM-dependent methyltransferase
MGRKDRSRLSDLARYALYHPARVIPYARRRGRDALLRLNSADHISYYRAVMKSDSARSAEAAVGSRTHESWLRVGQMQFDYLVDCGLRSSDRMLDIGCGNLRAGRLFIDYLDPGNYYGIDISPDILLAAQDTLAEYDLQDKLPYLTLVRDLKFASLPRGRFSVVHAHSVFSHSPIKVIDQCLANVGRIMTSDGIFDFTFEQTMVEEAHFLHEDYYYHAETLIKLANSYGFDAELLEDWQKTGHAQSKMRLTRRT